MAKEEILVLGCIVAVLIVLFVPLIDRAGAEKVAVGTGTVVDKIYTPSSSGTGTGMAFGGKSGVTPVMTHYHTDEAWVLLVRFEGETFSKECEPGVWGSASKGSSVQVYRKVGSFFDYGLTL